MHFSFEPQWWYYHRFAITSKKLEWHTYEYTSKTATKWVYWWEHENKRFLDLESILCHLVWFSIQENKRTFWTISLRKIFLTLNNLYWEQTRWWPIQQLSKLLLKPFMLSLGVWKPWQLTKTSRVSSLKTFQNPPIKYFLPNSDGVLTFKE